MCTKNEILRRAIERVDKALLRSKAQGKKHREFIVKNKIYLKELRKRILE